MTNLEKALQHPIYGAVIYIYLMLPPASAAAVVPQIQSMAISLCFLKAFKAIVMNANTQLHTRIGYNLSEIGIQSPIRKLRRHHQPEMEAFGVSTKTAAVTVRLITGGSYQGPSEFWMQIIQGPLELPAHAETLREALETCLEARRTAEDVHVANMSSLRELVRVRAQSVSQGTPHARLTA